MTKEDGFVKHDVTKDAQYRRRMETPIPRLLGCSDTMMPHAIPYARYILIGAPLNCTTFVNIRTGFEKENNR